MFHNNALKVVQNVETRWWSTFDLVDRLLYLENAVKLHEQVDKIGTLLSVTDWAILRQLNPLWSSS